MNMHRFFVFLGLLGIIGYHVNGATQMESADPEHIKQEFIKKFNLKEPCAEILSIAQDALTSCDITRPTIILEDPKPSRSYEGFVNEDHHHALFVLTSLRNKSPEEKNSKIFIAFHEAGHLYYHHHSQRKLIEKLIALETANPPNRASQAIKIPPQLKKLVENLISGYSLLDYYKAQEKQADLYACNQLIKQGREDVVLQSIIAPHASDEDEHHPSIEESRKYLLEHLVRNGRLGRELFVVGLKYAITFNNKEFMERMIAEGAWVNTSNVEGFTPLHRCAQTGDTDFAEKLIQRGASLNPADNKGLTPVMWAIEFNQESVFRQLIHHGAAVNTYDSKRNTPLHQAVLRGQTVFAQLLLQAGAHPHIPDSTGRSPKDWALARNDKHMINLFR